MTLISFHGDPTLKAHYVDRLRAGITAGRFLYSPVWEDGCGSALGLTIGGDDPVAYSELLGYPLTLVLALDMIVNFQRRDEATDFAMAWLQEAPVGADLWPLCTLLICQMLEEPGLRAITEQDPNVDVVRVEVLSLHRREGSGESVPRGEWREVRRRAVAASNAASSDVVRTAAAVAEAAAWPRETRTVLLDSLAAAGVAASTSRLADMNWTAENENEAFGLLETIAADEEAAGRSLDFDAMPALMEARAPELAERFARRNVCMEAGSAVYRGAGHSLLAGFRALDQTVSPVPEAHTS